MCLKEKLETFLSCTTEFWSHKGVQHGVGTAKKCSFDFNMYFYNSKLICKNSGANSLKFGSEMTWLGNFNHVIAS